jgi:hypothetical protein
MLPVIRASLLVGAGLFLTHRTFRCRVDSYFRPVCAPTRSRGSIWPSLGRALDMTFSGLETQPALVRRRGLFAVNLHTQYRTRRVTNDSVSAGAQAT